MEIVLLDKQKHNRNGFDCGNPALNYFLSHIANQQISHNQAKTYVLTEENDNQILGFYTLTMVQLELDYLPISLRKKYRYCESAGLIARLAVDIRHQQKGYGKKLLLDALLKLYQASQLVGFPVIFVDAKESKKSFYEQYGFNALPDPVLENKLFLTINTLDKIFN